MRGQRGGDLQTGLPSQTNFTRIHRTDTMPFSLAMQFHIASNIIMLPVD